MPEWKIKQYKEYLSKNEGKINTLSYHRNGIKAISLAYNQKLLEKQKSSFLRTSKLTPQWMSLTFHNKTEDNFKSIEYYPIKQKCKKQMALVDINLNPKKHKILKINNNRSIFSYGDFRNNVITKNQHTYFDSKVSQKPKKFFDWDDNTKFEPKYKKDI